MQGVDNKFVDIFFSPRVVTMQQQKLSLSVAAYMYNQPSVEISWLCNI